MSLIEWDETRFGLGLDFMDDTHKAFIAQVNRLAEASNAAFTELFDQLIEHTEEHFQQEEQLMQETAFPANAEHRDEHQRILGELRQFKKRVDKGLVSFGRNYVTQRLPEWFRLHAASMDSALAAHAKNTATDILHA